MISERPAFLEGEHFRVNRRADRKWRYTTLKTTRIKLDVMLDETISFRDRNGIEWMRLSPTICGKAGLSIREGYSWDGATMVPDACQHLPSMTHDALCQWRHTEHFPFSKREIDDAFLDLMKLAKFPLALVYWRGVRMFGWVFKSEDGEWSKVLTTTNL